jgi:hypothetical protein
MERGVEKHGSMACRKNEAVAIGPRWIGGIVAQVPLPQLIRYGRQTHGRARMAGICLLHGVNRQCAYGIDAQQVEIRLTHFGSYGGEGRLPRTTR